MKDQKTLAFFAYDWDKLVSDCLAGKQKVIFQGMIYYRRRKKPCYYKSISSREHREHQHLAQVIWRFCNGDIPPKHDIHHIDHNPGNNHPSNLVCWSKSKHARYHARLQSTRSVEEDHRIIKLYGQFHNIFKVGKAIDRSGEFVRLVLKDLGVVRDGDSSTRSEEEDHRIVELYGQLKSTDKVGKVVGRSSSFIGVVLKEYNIVLDGDPSTRSEEEDHRIIELYGQYHSCERVGKVVGRSMVFVWYVLKEYDVICDGNLSTRSEEEDHRIIKLYDRLNSTNKVGKAVGRTHSFVCRVLKEYNIRRGGHGPTRKQVEEIKVLLRKGGLTQHAIARKFDTSGATISRIKTGIYKATR